MLQKPWERRATPAPFGQEEPKRKGRCRVRAPRTSSEGFESGPSKRNPFLPPRNSPSPKACSNPSICLVVIWAIV